VKEQLTKYYNWEIKVNSVKCNLCKATRIYYSLLFVYLNQCTLFYLMYHTSVQLQYVVAKTLKKE